MNLFDLYENKPKRKRRAKRSAPKRAARRQKPLWELTRAELDALPEKEFLARLSPQMRRTMQAVIKARGRG